MGHAAVLGRLCVGAVDNLVDRVDRFPFTGTAAKNEDAGDEMEVLVVRGLLAMAFGIFALHEVRNTYRLPAVTAQYTAEVF